MIAEFGRINKEEKTILFPKKKYKNKSKQQSKNVKYIYIKICNQ